MRPPDARVIRHALDDALTPTVLQWITGRPGDHGADRSVWFFGLLALLILYVAWTYMRTALARQDEADRRRARQVEADAYEGQPMTYFTSLNPPAPPSTPR